MLLTQYGLSGKRVKDVKPMLPHPVFVSELYILMISCSAMHAAHSASLMLPCLHVSPCNSKQCCRGNLLTLSSYCTLCVQRWPLQCASCSAYQPRSGTAAQSDTPAPLQQLLRHPAFAQPLLTPAALWLQPLQGAVSHILAAGSKHNVQ